MPWAQRKLVQNFISTVINERKFPILFCFLDEKPSDYMKK